MQPKRFSPKRYFKPTFSTCYVTAWNASSYNDRKAVAGAEEHLLRARCRPYLALLWQIDFRVAG